MGSSPSSSNKVPKLRQCELIEFSRQTLFSPEEVEMLYKRFYEISKSEVDDGVIDFSEFCQNTRLPNSQILADRTFRLFDANGDRVINFREFLIGLSTFVVKNQETPRTAQETSKSVVATKYRDQIEASFRMLNPKEDDKIYMNDLKELLSSAVAENEYFKLNPDQVLQIIESLFRNDICLEDENGKYIDKDLYKRMIINDNRIVKWLGIDMERVFHIHKYVGVKKSRQRCLPL